jgi:hypothetical protein
VIDDREALTLAVSSWLPCPAVFGHRVVG